jgi:hypothetical protein
MTRQFSKAEPATDVASAKTLVFDLRKLIARDIDLDKQATLRSLLIEEMDKLAENREQLRLSGTESRDFQHSAELIKLIQQLIENFHQRVAAED